MAKWQSLAGFILTAIWLLTSIAFFGMVTSGGETGMELEIGPFIKLQSGQAVLFTRFSLAFGVLMLVLFLLRRPIGFLLASIWCVWWLVILSTALLGSPIGLTERLVILIVVVLFAVSGRFALHRFRQRTDAAGKPPVATSM